MRLATRGHAEAFSASIIFDLSMPLGYPTLQLELHHGFLSRVGLHYEDHLQHACAVFQMLEAFEVTHVYFHISV